MIKVIISGGGTGGHTFPAIAIANALKAKVKDIEFLFIGAKGRMEMEKVPQAGYRIEGLTISGFQRRLTWKNLVFPFKLIGSLLKAWSIISEFKPDVVIGVGGYASGPTLRVATFKKIPCLIQEQNSFPGATNTLLKNKVRKICVAYEGMEKFFPESKIVFTGNPVRQDLMDVAKKRDAGLKHFKLAEGRKTVLVIGGSLGARTINQAMLKFAGDQTAISNIQVIWQTGKYYYKQMSESFTKLSPAHKNIHLLPFIDRMDLAYAVADIIVSRAGAIAISELCIVGKPAILIPSPNVTQDHQTKNARALESRHAAILLPDVEAVDQLSQIILNTLSNESLQSEMKKNMTSMGISDAADNIADEALALLPQDSSPNVQYSGFDIPSSVYLLGIGGIGMSALARYFSLMGASVSGYDKTQTPLTDEMIREGMKIHFTEDIGQLPANPGLVIYTPAIPEEHAEFRYFREHGIPMKKRAEVLGMISRDYLTIAVAGTHGKTTTSTMIAHILRTAEADMMAFLGGISKNYQTNFLARPAQPIESGKQSEAALLPWCVVEADEYDRSFLQLTPHIAVITSADEDHLDIYHNYEELKRAFSRFTSKIGPGGSLIMKAGTPVKPINRTNYDVTDYAISAGAHYHADNIRVEDGLFHFDFIHPAGTLCDLVLGVPGKFNLENAVAALAVGHLLGIGEEHLRTAMQTYKSVLRRLDFRVRNADRVYIDDYAHHPEELRASISAVRDLYPGKKITGVFQPHLYSRTRDLADGFARSLELLDELILLEIYPAREEPIEGVTSQMLLDRVNLKFKKLVQKEDLLQEIRNGRPQVLLTLGAGDIDRFVEPITELLSEPTA
ncbi:MAG: UDP-N-acetylmuramate--L-alanine ligase [Bacteroidales bacterium]